ncbi:MAG: serine/threonine protein kinase [Anaerolineae bacterium]|nr:serine/threonine protein kinase [Anaerolineae bacterium]
MEDLVGQTLLDRYYVEEFVGRGGMAEVYRARDLRRRIPVALKFLREDMAEDEVFLRRFRREARVLETLQHPNIVRYYGFEETDNLHFLVVEFIDGEGLRKKLSRLSRPLTLAQALAILEPVCNALHYAHAEGIFHCDIKPANIMIDRTGRVVVADFGIAKLAESATVTSSTTGTPAYMAPEQCRGQKVDARTDIYALAITTFEMLTLDRPFTGEMATIQGAVSERIRWEQLKATPPSPRKYNPEIPQWAEQAILKALEKQRNRRFPSVLAFYDALSNGGKVTPDPVLPWAEEGGEPEAAPPTLVEPSTPEGATRHGQWEQRLTDALWAARRTWRRVADAWDQAARQVRRALAAGPARWLATARGQAARLGKQPRTGKRVLPYLLAGAVVVGIALAAWALAGRGTPAGTAPAATATPPRAVTVHATTPPAGSTAAAPSANAVYLTIETEKANIRSGPATVYPIIAVAERGQRFEVLARSPKSDWFEICCIQGKRGWVYQDRGKVWGDVETVPISTPTPPPPQQIRTEAGGGTGR